MTWLFEQSLPILGLGLVLCAGCLLALVKSGRGVFIYLAAACGALTVLGLVIESRVVTLREEIADTLDAIATDLESNDPDRILRHIATSRPGVRETAAQLLKEVSIDRVSVKNNLRIRPVENTEPEQLVADFNAVIIGTYQREGISSQTTAWYFVVTFVREDDAWRVLRYERLPPAKGTAKEITVTMHADSNSPDPAPTDHEVAKKVPTIDLDQFLKAHQLVESGGQAKVCIQAGEVTVNGTVETRRRRKLHQGDEVGFEGESYIVEFEV